MVFGVFCFCCFFFFERSERVKSPTQWQYETICAYLQPLLRDHRPPVPSLPSLHPCCLYPLCVFELCIQAAATFQCLNCHRLLHPRHAHQVRCLSLPQCPRPVCSPISAWEFGVWNVFWLLGRGSSPYHPQCGVMRRERRIFIRNWFCVANFLLCFFLFLFICFGLSVQDLQLLKSALPLIKPCSLQPDLCRDGFFPILKENPT